MRKKLRPSPAGRRPRGATLADIAALVLGLTLIMSTAEPAAAREWTEEDFAQREPRAYTFVPPTKTPGATTKTVIGHMGHWRAERGDTFLDIGRHFDLGHNTMVGANPGIDEWVPYAAKKAVAIPTEWILPCCQYEGLVVNVPEMRLYWYPPAKEGAPRTVVTFPVGLGRQQWRTPQGDFRIVEKARNPTWVIPESIRKERFAEDGSSERSIAGGDPANPLGAYRMRLSLPAYAIHGTNIPWGVGMSVSHGCLRMYPEDIHELFAMVPHGAKGSLIYQTIKVGRRDGQVFVEVHPDLYGLQPGPWRETMRLLDEKGLRAGVDEKKLLVAIQEKRGHPVDVTRRIDDATGRAEKPLRPTP
ncbi:MAG: L,D-transpeptidase family protein [Deltaproteobacteria bacterium]